MRKGIAGRCLCVALASAMVFGDAGIALAAESGSADSREAVSLVAADDTGETVKDPHISYMNVDEQYGSRISISAGVYAYKAMLYVNGKKLDEVSYGYDDAYLYVSKYIDALPGSTYSVEIRMVNSENKVVKSLKKLVTSSVGFGESQYSPKLAARVISDTVTENGIKKPSSIRLIANINNTQSYRYNYEVYRSTKSDSGYQCIYRGDSSESWSLQYEDTTAKAGTTYYYRIKLLSGTDTYITSEKVLAVSPTVSIRYGTPECSLSAYVYGRNKGSAGVVNLSMWSDLANRYDIYRSTSETKGYRKIATVSASYYSDAKVKKGTVYYYKVVPKYYDSRTGKTITGKTTEAVAVKYLMDGTAPTLTQVGTNSMKCEWYADNSADVSYEIWCRRSDVTGDAYVRKAVTKKNSCVIKGLAANGEYEVKIRTVKKAGNTVKYATSGSARRIMGYTSSVQDFGYSTVKSTADSKTVSVYYNLTWYRDWNASGYKITAYNNYTKKRETIKKITSGKTTSYTFKNTGTVGKTVKYSQVYVLPYKGKQVGTAEFEGYDLDRLPSPARVTVTRKSGTAVKIAWTAVKGVSSYTVVRTTALGVTQTIATVKGTSYIDTHVTNGLGYTYSVYSATSKTEFASGYNSGYVTYVHKLSTPQVTAATNSAKGASTVKWAKVPNAKSYQVYRSDKLNGNYAKVGSASKDVLQYTDKSVKKGKTYYYKVVAYAVNDCGQIVKSATSKAKSVKINK